MSIVVMIDTSAWVQALRRDGDAAVRSRVRDLMASESAAWCQIVRLELWAGVRGEQERSQLRRLDRVLPRLAITEETWEAAVDLASRSREAGLTFPSTGLLIFACGSLHGVEIEHADKHFSMLKQLAEASNL